MIAAQRLRKGSCGSPRGAARLAADALAAAPQPAGRAGTLVRADSAFYSHAPRRRAQGRRRVSRSPCGWTRRSKRAIATIDEDAWTTIKYTDAIYDETTGSWISKAEVAEIPFTAFVSTEEGRAGPRPADRPPHPRPQPRRQATARTTLFDTWRFHAFFTTTDPASWTRSPRTRPTAGTRRIVPSSLSPTVRRGRRSRRRCG